MNPILDNILQLPIADRLELIEQIWDSIDTTAGPFPLSELQKAELDRRLELHDRDPQGTSWNQLKQRLLDR